MGNTFSDLRNEDINKYVDIVRNYAKGQAHEMNSTSVLLLFGDDFAHPEAHKSYAIMDAIIERIEGTPNLTVKYSRVGDWLDGVKAHGAATNKEWHVHRGDFFPYETDQQEYWSGYYTTLPYFKRLTRQFADYTSTTSFLASMSIIYEG